MISHSATGLETVGQRLRRLRVAHGLSQRSLAGPGVTSAYVSQIEADARRPSMKALRVLAGKLGVTAAYLETGSELDDAEMRELRLAEAELRLRLEGEAPTDELRLILQEAIASGDSASVVRVQIALGLEAAGRGDHAEAVGQLEAAVASDRVTPALRPDVYATLGESHALAGEPARAVALFETVLGELERLAPDDFGARVRFGTYLSYALTDLGELERAREAVEDALRFVDQASDPYMRIRLFWALGRISYEQSKPLLALEYFRRAVTLLETTEDTFHLARAHLSCALAMLASGHDLSETRRQVDKAERLLGPKPEARDVAVVHLLKAMHAVQIGDHAMAEAHARDSQALTEQLPNQYGLATWVLADALAGQRDARAEESYAEATRLLQEHGTRHEQLELSRAYARYRTLHGEHLAPAAPASADSSVGPAAAQPAEPALPDGDVIEPTADFDAPDRSPDFTASLRARTAAELLARAAERDEAARARDLAAAARDRTAEQREAAIHAGKREAEERRRRRVEPGRLDDDSAAALKALQVADASIRRQSALERSAAAADRRAAAADREHAAADLNVAGLDELTGVFRRGTGELALSHEIGRSRRSNQSLVLAMIDIDRLKAVNDSQGHPAGDVLICNVARAIISTIRSYDVTVRWGGDEFVCSLSDVTLAVAADRIAQIQRALDAYHPGATISTGLAELAPDDTYSTLLARADAALRGNKADRDR